MEGLFSERQLLILDQRDKRLTEEWNKKHSQDLEELNKRHLQATKEQIEQRVKPLEIRVEELESRVNRIEKYLPFDIVGKRFEKATGRKPEQTDKAYEEKRAIAPLKEFSSIGEIARVMPGIKWSRKWGTDGTLSSTKLGNTIHLVHVALFGNEPRKTQRLLQYWAGDEQLAVRLTIDSVSHLVFPEIYGELPEM